MFMYLHRASWHSSATLTEVFSILFPQLLAKCQCITRKDGARPALFQKFVCCSIYCLFCVVLCTVCVKLCTVLLPPGGNSIAI
jgi:hypothetical protein